MTPFARVHTCKCLNDISFQYFVEAVQKAGWRIASVNRYLFEPAFLVTLQSDSPKILLPLSNYDPKTLAPFEAAVSKTIRDALASDVAPDSR